MKNIHNNVLFYLIMVIYIVTLVTVLQKMRVKEAKKIQ